MVNGSLVVDHTYIQWGNNPDVINNPEYTTEDFDEFAGQYLGGTGWDNAESGSTNGTTYVENIKLSSPGVYYFVAKAQVEIRRIVEWHTAKAAGCAREGYLYLGVEAAAWITYASFKTSQNDKEQEFFAFADERFSIDAFEKDCVDQSGQPCDQAVAEIRNFYLNDKTEYYEIISKDPIFRAGWGVRTTPDPTWSAADSLRGFVYENGSPPEGDTPEFRTWIADQAGAQDTDYADYNDLRNDRNALGRTARGMTMVVLINHLVSAWDALMLARRFNADLGDQVSMKFRVKTSFDDPGASVTFRRAF